MPKKIYIRTFGCQMNVRDSEALLGLFLERGYQAAKDESQADIILVNTCSVRAHAENRALSYLGSLKKFTERRRTRGAKRKVIGLIGCMAKNLGEEVYQRMSHVDLICGPASLAKIPVYCDKIKKDNIRIIDLDDDLRDEEFYRSSFRLQPDHAQVVISTGCSNHCSYCVVPFVRGELRLRRPEDVIVEVKRNIDLGIKKITLLGQNVNDYPNFIDLLSKVEKIAGIEELNFITSQPRNVPEGLFEFMARSGKISKHLHLPFQSGSNRILKKMNRGYTRQNYLQLVDSYKKIVKGTLSTDVIVGFPTEADKDFLATKDILEKVRFRKAYIFKYSPRPRAKSSKMVDDVSDELKVKRHKILLDLQKKISLNK
ncbi:MAG: MiaB/RimO family radical SAM methylthiotransferase [Candidatus Omnitrophica bacterium]|nr:MiaB/RimO family radical SAM methylthiotransferase [Candidatus Omnitrophota bacterium]MBU2251248.1 MiaB/RimO family radical SAM methylthiotransferase [Candidatus Omnitrophota bacterium]MBU2474275.1 MiaB/RimO family radical SAM methylthiotransferase [Candidatus Omnitrophota bacterium]